MPRNELYIYPPEATPPLAGYPVTAGATRRLWDTEGVAVAASARDAVLNAFGSRHSRFDAPAAVYIVDIWSFPRRLFRGRVKVELYTRGVFGMSDEPPFRAAARSGE